MTYKLDFHTAYNQFYIIDPTRDGNTGSDNFWTDTAFEDRLAIENGVIGVGIGSYGHVKAEFEVLDKPKLDINYSEYDHIVEGGIRIESGILQITSCPTNEVELSIIIEPGKYRVRIYSSGLGEFDTDEDEGEDYYKIEIWPDINFEKYILKRRQKKS